MSSQIPPNPYFSGINYNPGFFSSITDYLTVAIANSKYLKIIGGTLNGFLGILRTPRVALDVNGQAVINDGTSGIPANATLLGSAGTKLILKEGGGLATPIALGTYLNDLWYGVSGVGNHLFYSGTNERVRINDVGNVGIGTNNPQEYLDLYNGTQSGNSPYIKLRGGGGSNNSVGIILNPFYNRTALTTTKIFAIDDGFSSANLCFATADTGSVTTEAVERMRIKTNGNVGIGTNDPQSKLHLHTPTNSTYVSLKITDNTTGIGATDGISITKTDQQDMFLFVYENARMIFFTNNLVRMILSAAGYLGIGDVAPSNILQVGTGQRLRISNGSTDYSQIGVSDAGINNTCIVLSGHQRPGTPGNIEYIAVNEHVFYTTHTGSYIDRVRLNPDDFQIKTSCSTYGANYYTDGEFLFSMERTNTSGTAKTGYFISNEWFYNSLVMLAVSHNGATYTYWHGYYGTNNSTATMYITALNQSNMTVEAFQEQTTLKYYLFLRPSIAFNQSVQMRVKFYG